MDLRVAARAHPVVATLWLLVAVAALVQCARASVFAGDASRRECSVQPSSTFRTEHNCFTAYAEAVRFTAEPGANIYDAERYRPGTNPRRIGPFTVDPYHYPPPFLLLPGVVAAVSPGFLEARRTWFAVQVLLLLAGVFATAWWIGGREGAGAALAGAAFFALPTTWAALQSGNFQTSAIALSMVAMMLAWSGRTLPGGTLLAWTASAKIFPAMLVLHVLAARRRRLVSAVAGGGVAILLVTLAAFGTKPFADFLGHELPALASGAAFPQIEQPQNVVVNLSVYGMAAKLRLLGLSWLDPAAARLASRVYALLLGALVVWVGVRSAGAPVPGRERLERAAAWLALLNLASFAGPFVGGLYGAVGTTWLLALLAGGASTPWTRAAWLVALAAGAWVPFATPTPRIWPTPPVGWALASAAWQLGAIALNAWVALRARV